MQRFHLFLITQFNVANVTIDELPSNWEEVLEVTSLNHLDLSKYNIGSNGLIKITKTLKKFEIPLLEKNNLNEEYE
ncbi:16205_t:CDS:2 [Gigaspora margarita]|uniref:16205_t:CDS:1 n=1 Tax=Gigaspora margarita TaxID=4874 RepID=A0ABN7UTT6_GIGMA|nr:16205_t:CDS:2 [Gigaspora margarita]